jgi:hypothetical protein
MFFHPVHTHTEIAHRNPVLYGQPPEEAHSYKTPGTNPVLRLFSTRSSLRSNTEDKREKGNGLFCVQDNTESDACIPVARDAANAE